MENPLLNIAVTMISVFFIVNIITFIQIHDKDHGIVLDNNILIFLMLLLPALFHILQNRYGICLKFWFYSYLISYLCISALIDQQTKNVYDFLNFITIALGVIFVILNTSDIEDITFLVIQLMLFGLIILIQVKRKIYGEGDGFLLMAISIFLSTNENFCTFEILLINIGFANLIFILIHLNKFNLRKLRMSESLPFVPSIAVSTLIIILM